VIICWIGDTNIGTNAATFCGTIVYPITASIPVAFKITNECSYFIAQHIESYIASYEQTIVAAYVAVVISS
jgi:hypothetical protein